MPTPDTTPAALMGLAERVEGLSGPDREVDALVAIALAKPPANAFRPSAAEDVGTFSVGGYGFWTCEHYTASLDAALKLVPEGAHYGLGHDANGPMVGWAWVRLKAADGWHEVHSPERMGFRHVEPWPQSPALALTTAALRARALAHSAEQGGEG